MKSLKWIYIAVLNCLLLFPSCDSDHDFFFYRVHIEFQDSQGNNLIEKSRVLIDTLPSYAGSSYSLNKKEYRLDLKIDQTKQEADVVWYKHATYPVSGFSFSCDPFCKNMNGKGRYEFCYDFVCPKLFGDETPRRIRAVWRCVKGKRYVLDQLFFEDQLIGKGESGIAAKVVL